MKIGILTYQHANNFGAALQAFALVEYLNSLGHDAEIINYHSQYLADKYKDKSVVNRRGGATILSYAKLLLSKRMLNKRKDMFENFRKTMGISFEKYNSANIEKTNDLYDVFIAGSDQIWNHLLSNSDATYMLDFVIETNKKMSYASSFGLEAIEENKKLFYEKPLSKISHMSVREETGANIVYDLIGRTPEVVLDPCLLLSSEQWVKQTNQKRSYRKPYILVYMFTGSNLNKVLSGTGLDVSKYTVIKINGNITFKDFLKSKTKVKFGIGPKEFINLFLHADIVLTDSFHGTVFSVIFKKRFVTVLRELQGKNARVIDFLEPIGLGDRIYNSKMDANKVLESPEYEEVYKLLNGKIEHSKKFIDKSLETME